MPSSLDAKPSREVCMPIAIVPESSTARYRTYTLPSRTIAPGLKVCSASQCTGWLVMGSVKTGLGLGSMMGAWTGRTKGPSIQSRFCAGWAEPASSRTKATATVADLPVALLFATVKDMPDLSVLAVGDKKSAIGSFRHTVGAGQCVVRIYQWVLAGEPAGEDLKLARGLAAGEWLEGYVRRRLWQRGPVPGTMKSDKRTALVARGKLAAGI